MSDNPLELVWWKWRVSYRKQWGLRPPAKRISSMVIDSFEVEGDCTKYRVTVQTGKLSFESSVVVIYPDDRSSYEALRVVLDSPKDNWGSLPDDVQRQILGVWKQLEGWALSVDGVGDLELSNRLVKMFDLVRDRYGVKRPVGLVMYLALGVLRIDKGSHEVLTRLSLMLLEMDGVLDLYRECKKIQALTKNKEMGFLGDPRTIWEDRRGLVSAESRWDFAKERMKYYGFS